VDLALRRFDRVVGLREGRMQFDAPAAQVTAAMLCDLYATEGGTPPTQSQDASHALAGDTLAPAEMCR